MGWRSARERGPIQAPAVVGIVARGQNDGLIDAAHGRRNPSARQCGESGGHSGDDAKGHARRRERQNFFAAAAEDEGVAALQSQHAQSAARKIDEQCADVFLGDGGLAASLAGEVQPRALARQGQNAGIDQRVVNDHVGLNQARQCIESQQPGISGPRAHQPDFAGREYGIRRRATAASACAAEISVGSGDSRMDRDQCASALRKRRW